ncbi:hypothetical protein HK105_201293 [Polyrhizophydium stewartii]|uniref:Rnh202 triple barrel domain-containing protein n=1 Tax=Polyrhizophydium stewartii TaxID=2732419 RepID=A0ABR4NHL1_9FUNG
MVTPGDSAKRLMLLPQLTSGGSTHDSRVLTLPRPCDGAPSGYVLHSGAETPVLLQIQRLEAPFRSWALDDSVVSDGSLYALAPFDMLFMALQLLDARLSEVQPASADVEGVARFYRLNRDKALGWLRAKVRRIQRDAEGLISVQPHLSWAGATEQDIAAQRDVIAFQVVEEHLTSDWRKRLAEALGLQNHPAVSSDKLVYFNTNLPKRSAVEHEGVSAETTQPATKKAKPTRGQKSIMTASKAGMKPLTSFFKPANK